MNTQSKSRKSGARNSRRCSRGLSLIELMVAAGVLTVAGVGSVALMSNMFIINRDSVMRSQATALATETINMLYGMTAVAKTHAQFDGALNALPGMTYTGTCAQSTACSCTDTKWVAGGWIKREIFISAAGAGILEGAHAVRVTVTWSNRGRERNVNFNSAIARP